MGHVFERRGVDHATARQTIAKQSGQRGRARDVLAIDRSNVPYRSIQSDDAELRKAMKEGAAERRRFGYRGIHMNQKQQLLSFLLGHGLHYENGKYWTLRHLRWLAENRRFRPVHQQLVFEELK